MSEELWRDVVGYEGLYQVSNHGRVKSLDKSITQKNRWGLMNRVMKGTIINPFIDRGYKRVTLTKNGIKKHLSVHTLLLSAFVGERPDGNDGCHNDGDPSNNHISNLRWDTKKANQADRKKHGTDIMPRGEKHHSSNFKNDEVRFIKKLLFHKVPYQKIAKLFGIPRTTISAIKHGYNWKHVQYGIPENMVERFYA